MGDIADMMLDGTFCGTCGVFLDRGSPGYPQYCSSDCEPEYPDQSTSHSDAEADERKRAKRKAKRRRARLVPQLRDAALTYARNPTVETTDKLLRVAREYGKEPERGED